ncbi:hypothetical protein EPJ69_09765 [Brachyspira aalborgi]|uniref:Uncharacterized protein n=1 Tax=Brachyspira aalborgi TaxID=29522 RepID=A0A5C8DXF2_9SPIR|nr:hypothetical protein [Brachyspira aalborgi]TXJ30349.1 hypothetical protein EPJ69_09765 [Brachyspira aalborgi]
MQKIFILLTLTILFMASCFDSSENIDIVKNGSFYSYPDITVGKMVNTIFEKVNWEEIIADDGNSYVNMYGYTEDDDEVLIQFRIKYRDNLEKYWEVNAMEMNGEPTTTRGIANDLYDLYIANK